MIKYNEKNITLFLFIISILCLWLWIQYHVSSNPPQEDLKAIKSSKKPIKILIVFNGKYKSEAENLLASIKKNTPSLVNHIIVCVSDKSSKSFAIENNLEYFQMPEIKPAKKIGFGTKSQNRFTQRKYEAILHLLDKGEKVLYTDTDIVFLRNPLGEIPDGDYDIAIQNDSETDTMGNLCTGFIYLKPTDKSKKLIRGALDLMQSAWFKKVGDQYAFNMMINNKNLKDPAKIHILDECIFPNGIRYFDKTLPRCTKHEAVIVHNNYIMGLENKQERFKKHDLMFT